MKGTTFIDNSGGEFEITHVTDAKYTVLITKKPREGAMTVAHPDMKLSDNEFVMTRKRFVENISLGNISQVRYPVDN